MPNKYKIFLFNPYPGIGGTDTTINRLINSIDFKRFDVEYLSLKKVKYNKNKKVIFTQLNSSSTFFSFFEICKILKKDRHEKKLFFSMQYFVNVWTIIFIKLFLGIKIFIYEVNHLDELNYYKNFQEYLKKTIIKVLVRIFYSYADVVAGNSSVLVKKLQDYTKHKVYRIYNPCFDRIKKKTKHYYPRKIINLLCISRLESQKDHFTLLKAINHTTIKDNINLTLVGNGSKKNDIQKYIKIKNIKAQIFLNTKRLSSFYKRSDLFVSTSLYEGLPTTMVEAASYCLPIISSDFKSGAREILSNGKSGFLFKIKDYKRLAHLIESFYNNPKKFLKKETNCRKNLARFSIKKNTKIFNNLVNMLI
jgi:glycosyltransferase involved in cell wall biosynthesis